MSAISISSSSEDGDIVMPEVVVYAERLSDDKGIMPSLVTSSECSSTGNQPSQKLQLTDDDYVSISFKPAPTQSGTSRSVKNHSSPSEKIEFAEEQPGQPCLGFMDYNPEHFAETSNATTNFDCIPTSNNPKAKLATSRGRSHADDEEAKHPAKEQQFAFDKKHEKLQRRLYREHFKSLIPKPVQTARHDLVKPLMTFFAIFGFFYTLGVFVITSNALFEFFRPYVSKTPSDKVYLLLRETDYVLYAMKSASSLMLRELSTGYPLLVVLAYFFFAIRHQCLAFIRELLVPTSLHTAESMINARIALFSNPPKDASEAIKQGWAVHVQDLISVKIELKKKELANLRESAKSKAETASKTQARTWYDTFISLALLVCFFFETPSFAWGSFSSQWYAQLSIMIRLSMSLFASAVRITINEFLHGHVPDSQERAMSKKAVYTKQILCWKLALTNEFDFIVVGHTVVKILKSDLNYGAMISSIDSIISKPLRYICVFKLSTYSYSSIVGENIFSVMISSTSRANIVARQLTEMVSPRLDFKALSVSLAICIGSLIHQREIIELFPSLMMLSVLTPLVWVELSLRKFEQRLVDRLVFQILVAIRLTAQKFLPHQVMEQWRPKKVAKFYLRTLVALLFTWMSIVINLDEVSRAHIAILGISWILNILYNIFSLVPLNTGKITKQDAGWIMKLNRALHRSCFFGLALDLGLMACLLFPMGHIVIPGLWVLVFGLFSSELLGIAKSVFAYESKKIAWVLVAQQTYTKLSANLKKVAMPIQKLVQFLDQLLQETFHIVMELPLALQVGLVIGIIGMQVFVEFYFEIKASPKILSLFVNGKKRVVG